MRWLAILRQGNTSRRVSCIAFAVFVPTFFAPLRCPAQALQKGVSVEEAVTRNAVDMPNADKPGAWVVAITANGNTYFGINPTDPANLTEVVERGLGKDPQKELYIKADARTSYVNVVKVLDAVRKAGITAPNLLTNQRETPQPGRLLLPKGLVVRVGPPLPPAAESTLVQVINAGQAWPVLKINSKDVPWANLESELNKLFTNRTEKAVFVKATGELPYARVVHVIDVCPSMGARVFLATPAL